jgi:hypothetical protein
VSDKQRPRTNPRAGSNDPELWDTELDWYFNDFESLCGLQSVGTSGAGQNQLNDSSQEEKLDRLERIKNGFLLTLPGNAKPDAHSVSSVQADKAFSEAQARGIFARGRRIWQRIYLLPYRVQHLLRQAYEERIPEAGANWGRSLLTDDQVRACHLAFEGREYLLPVIEVGIAKRTPSVKWINPEPIQRWNGGKDWPQPQYIETVKQPRQGTDADPDEEETLDLVDLIAMSEETGIPIDDFD